MLWDQHARDDGEDAVAHARADDEGQRRVRLLDRIPASAEDRTEAALLRARALLDGDQPHRVLDALDELSGDLGGTAATVLRGRALVAVGRLDEGLTALRRAAAASGNGRQDDEAVCELAAACLAAGRLGEAESVLAAFIDAGPGGEPELAARGLALYGRLERAQQRDAVAARYFLDALALLDRTAAPAPGLRSALALDVAAIAAGSLDSRLYGRVRRELETAPPAAGRRFSSRRAAVLGELLCGDDERAWRIAFDALRAVPAGIAYVSALLDAALAASAAGDRFTPAQLIREAAADGECTDWGRAQGDDRQALLRLAAALAPADPARAAALLAVYETLPGDPRWAAAEHPVHGLARAALAGATGRRPEQRSALAGAAAAARAAGDHYAEVQAVLALAELDADAGLLQRADELTRAVQRSWLRRRYEALAAQAGGPARLTVAERRVMHAICEGRTTLDIAQRFGRSKNTIRNQTRRVYEVMGVGSRSALVAKCAAMGLLAAAGR